MSITAASLSQAPVADTPGQPVKKVPPKRQTIVAATTVLIPQPR
jgi:hypothetical protein